jgi:hypothetical protein
VGESGIKGVRKSRRSVFGGVGIGRGGIFYKEGSAFGICEMV